MATIRSIATWYRARIQIHLLILLQNLPSDQTRLSGQSSDGTGYDAYRAILLPYHHLAEDVSRSDERLYAFKSNKGRGMRTCCCSISYWPTSSEVRLLSSATSLYPLSLFGLPPSSISSNREYPPLLGDACRGSFGWLSSVEESPWIAFNDRACHQMVVSGIPSSLSNTHLYLRFHGLKKPSPCLHLVLSNTPSIPSLFDSEHASLEVFDICQQAM